MGLFTIQNLNFTYPGQEKPALSNISFQVEPGEFIIICGKSGCGKTTLLRHFKTAMMPYGSREGKVLFQGEDLEQVSIRKQASEIGYVLQNPDHQIVTDKVWHELAFGLENLGYEQEVIRLRVAEMASYFGIQNWFYKGVEELSGGQKQLLNLASVMAMQPVALILDEPTSQLDPIAAGDFLSTIKKINRDLGTTVIMIEHRLEEVFYQADRVLVLEDGKKLFFDTPRQVGKQLKGKDLFLAMPAPLQIYEGVKQEGECPLTVREGRNWLGEICKNPSVTEVRRIEKEEPDLTAEPVIRLKDIWFRYEKQLPDVIRGLTMEVKKGELYCILGGNGTGKTTTLSLISGICKPYRGKVWIKGKETKKYKRNELFQGILAALPQNPQCLFVKDTVEEDLYEILTPEQKKDKEKRIETVVEETQIGHLLKMHPYDLSGGEQQRAALAKVLLLNPEVILLDEPTKGMDGYYKKKLADIFLNLKKKGITILMVSHDIEFCASYGDVCAMFFDGGIVMEQDARTFFSGNSFYTTAANKMARQVFPDAVTVKDVIELCRANGI